MSDPLPTSPLAGADTDTLTALFESDPLTLTDTQLETLIIELRRRRNAFLADEAAKQAAGKKARAKPEPQPASAAAVLDKPVGETTLDDIL